MCGYWMYVWILYVCVGTVHMCGYCKYTWILHVCVETVHILSKLQVVSCFAFSVGRRPRSS